VDGGKGSDQDRSRRRRGEAPEPGPRIGPEGEGGGRERGRKSDEQGEPPRHVPRRRVQGAGEKPVFPSRLGDAPGERPVTEGPEGGLQPARGPREQDVERRAQVREQQPAGGEYARPDHVGHHERRGAREPEASLRCHIALLPGSFQQPLPAKYRGPAAGRQAISARRPGSRSLNRRARWFTMGPHETRSRRGRWTCRP